MFEIGKAIRRAAERRKESCVKIDIMHPLHREVRGMFSADRSAEVSVLSTQPHRVTVLLDSALAESVYFPKIIVRIQTGAILNSR